MKEIFGGSEAQSQQTSSGGFGALPASLQKRFTQLGKLGGDILSSPEQYFSPIGLTSGELQAQQLIDPSNIQANIGQYLNPYRDIITQDINKQFEAPQGALAARASEAGAFGGSRMRSGQSDLERQRLDSITSALSGQYNTAFDQLQQGISNLMGFGSLERGVDLAQRQAPVSAFGAVSSGLSPLLTSKEGQGTSESETSTGILPALSGFFSDERLKENVEQVGFKNGLNVYEYNYLWSPIKFIGYMAQEVEKLYPKAMGSHLGYKTVNYNLIGG